MKQPLRILDTGLKPARWNVAMTAALVEMHGKGQLRDTVRFHRYPASVLLGRNQRVEQAANVAYCRAEGIEIARRVTGGGAVFMSPRMLAWDVVVDRRAWGHDLEAATRGICEGVAAGIARLGVAARYRPPNDIEIGGRKVSGSSGYCDGPSAVLQGTVIVQDQIAAMASALGFPESTLRERVTSLEAARGRVASVAVLIQTISGGLAEAFQRDPVPQCLKADELALCESLLSGIGSDAFVADAAAEVAGTFA